MGIALARHALPDLPASPAHTPLPRFAPGSCTHITTAPQTTHVLGCQCLAVQHWRSQSVQSFELLFSPTSPLWHPQLRKTCSKRASPRSRAHMLLERVPSHVPQTDSRERLFHRSVYQSLRTSHGPTHALVSPLYYPHTPQLRSTRYILPHAEHDLPSPRSFRT
jgi:hypothetical protein